MPTPPDTVYARIARHAVERPGAHALESPGKPPLTFGKLVEIIDATIGALSAAGIGRGDVVAVVLPHASELATACLAVSACAQAAPLNPEYRRAELEFHFASLKPRLVILPAGRAPVARDVARATGVAVADLHADAASTGAFRLSFPTTGGSATGRGRVHADDVALWLHTSGTTARPKKVPLTQSNLVASAEAMIASVALTSSDRCLHVLPMFHIGGIVDVLMAPLMAGGTVVCTSGFSVPEFFLGLEVARPTWTQAVPTMLRELVDAAPEHRGAIARRPLRFIRSVSAALPVDLLKEVQGAFGAPVVEIYGMTETAGVIASNPFPSGMRKPGSVGVAAGPEVAVVDERGVPVPTGQRGEVVVRGRSVMRGYADDEATNAASWFGDWFRTGDEGTLDADGFLYLTGRIKEIINRGGEKISPREVDEVLLSHPAVAEAATFAIPHPSLGEEVATVVVLKPGSNVSKTALTEHVGSRLAYFKVPRVVHFLQAIPKTAGGKLQRNRLAETLGLRDATAEAPRAAYVAPRTPFAAELARLWEATLGVERVGLDDDFFALGGDSLKAASFVNQIQHQWHETVYVTAVFDAPTLARLESYLSAHHPELVAKMTGAAVPSSGPARRAVDPDALRRFRRAIAKTLGEAPLPPKRNPQAVFVLSSPRSGSTLVRAMLGGNRALFAPPELYLLPFDTLADRKAWFSGSQRFQLEGNTRALMQMRGIPPEEAEAAMARLEAARTPVHEYYGTIQRELGGRLLVDKTPYYAHRLDTLERAEALFEDALYIHLVRHPYGVIRSFEEAKLASLWYPRLVGTAEAERTPNPWPGHLFPEMLWTVLNQNIAAFLAGVPSGRQLRLRFEDLVADPGRASRALCEFVGVPFDPAMLEPHADRRARMTDGVRPESRMIGDMKFHEHRTIDASVADLWKREYHDDFLSGAAWDVAASLGYEETASRDGRIGFEL
ncbi:MAG: hypothetical protein AMXMBFR42_03060 [Burkholderiales bacterium]